MLYTELKNQNLFEMPQGFYLAHCISADFTLGAGIAKQFVEIYNMKNKLKTFFPEDYLDNDMREESVGTAILIDNVFNLITKNRVYHKPTYDSVRNALTDMKRQMQGLMINRIAMPQIACGLDGLNWETVSEIIKEIFEDTEVEIYVCIL